MGLWSAFEQVMPPFRIRSASVLPLMSPKNLNNRVCLFVSPKCPKMIHQKLFIIHKGNKKAKTLFHKIGAKVSKNLHICKFLLIFLYFFCVFCAFCQKNERKMRETFKKFAYIKKK